MGKNRFAHKHRQQVPAKLNIHDLWGLANGFPNSGLSCDGSGRLASLIPTIGRRGVDWNLLYSSTVNKFDPAHNLFDLSTDNDGGHHFHCTRILKARIIRSEFHLFRTVTSASYFTMRGLETGTHSTMGKFALEFQQINRGFPDQTDTLQFYVRR